VYKGIHVFDHSTGPMERKVAALVSPSLSGRQLKTGSPVTAVVPTASVASISSRAWSSATIVVAASAERRAGGRTLEFRFIGAPAD